MGMGIILSALSSGGKAAADTIDQDMKADRESQLLEQRSDLEQRKAIALAQFNNDLQNAPMNRAGASVAEAMKNEVPVTAAPVQGLTGADPKSAYREPDGSATTGIIGDAKQVAEIRARAQAMPDDNPDKAGLIAQLDRQTASDQKTADDAVAGQTRMPTREEAVAAATKTALARGDLQAVAALKAINTDKYSTLAAGATLFDSTTGRVVLTNNSNTDRELIRADAALARVQAKTESNEYIAELKASIGKLGGGSNSPKMQSIAYMEAHPDLFTQKDIQSVMLERPAINEADIATRIIQSDPNAGTKRAISADDAVAKAKAITSALRGAPVGAPPAAATGQKALTYDPATGGFK